MTNDGGSLASRDGNASAGEPPIKPRVNDSYLDLISTSVRHSHASIYSREPCIYICNHELKATAAFREFIVLSRTQISVIVTKQSQLFQRQLFLHDGIHFHVLTCLLSPVPAGTSRTQRMHLLQRAMLEITGFARIPDGHDVSSDCSATSDLILQSQNLLVSA